MLEIKNFEKAINKNTLTFSNEDENKRQKARCDAVKKLRDNFTNIDVFMVAFMITLKSGQIIFANNTDYWLYQLSEIILYLTLSVLIFMGFVFCSHYTNHVFYMISKSSKKRYVLNAILLLLNSLAFVASFAGLFFKNLEYNKITLAIESGLIMFSNIYFKFEINLTLEEMESDAPSPTQEVHEIITEKQVSEVKSEGSEGISEGSEGNNSTLGRLGSGKNTKNSQKIYIHHVPDLLNKYEGRSQFNTFYSELMPIFNEHISRKSNPNFSQLANLVIHKPDDKNLSDKTIKKIWDAYCNCKGAIMQRQNDDGSFSYIIDEGSKEAQILKEKQESEGKLEVPKTNSEGSEVPKAKSEAQKINSEGSEASETQTNFFNAKS